MKILCKIKNNIWIEFGEIYYPLALRISARQGIAAYIQCSKDNSPILTSLSGFEIIDQIIPSSWVKQDMGDDIFYFLPKNWTYPEFFDELIDDELPKAVRIFNEEAVKIYKELGAPGYE